MTETRMSASVKFLIGLAASLLAGWISHGPFGQGKAFVDGLETQAQAAVRDAGVSGVSVRFARDPLKREAILSGNANDYQREGMGQYPGLNDRMRAIPGVSGVRWDDSAEAMRMPLWAETELLVVLFYGIGVLIARFLFRPRKEHFL